jgi:hypothetical protein
MKRWRSFRRAHNNWSRRPRRSRRGRGIGAIVRAAAVPDPRLARIREHLRRYRELAGAGKWAEAGKELEAIEAEVGK